ncbi:MAG: AzlC family ABC transporter permease [Erysipelotrichaceae bacterium]|nr:AzlC family ABC transporter permease [Erysipelotrichaceae bacterium]
MNKEYFIKGIKDGIPIGLGYFAVAFSLGIAASNAGLTPFESLLSAMLLHASAGQSAGYTAIQEQIPYLEIIIVTIVANARYILMSFALSQKINPKESTLHRMILGYYLTDEFFGLAISQESYCNPYYVFGAASFAGPCWSLGILFGTIMGNILPNNIVSCLSVALYAMFLAIFIPPAKKDRAVALLVILSFISSFVLYKFVNISTSTITIILTILISSFGAILFPRGIENEE